MEPGTLEIEELHDYERARAFAPPPTLRFVVGAPTVADGAIRLSGELINDADAPQEVIVSSSWLSLAPADPRLTRRPRGGPPNPPPPVPPPPMRFVMAPHERRSFQTMLSLLAYDFVRGADVELVWSFGFWNEPRPGGRLLVALP